MKSTRIAEGKALEIHLKKNVEVTPEMCDHIPQLPTSDPFVVVTYNKNSGKWTNAKTFDNFREADEHFTERSKGEGYDAGRLKMGKPERHKHGRMIGGG